MLLSAFISANGKCCVQIFPTYAFSLLQTNICSIIIRNQIQEDLLWIKSCCHDTIYNSLAQVKLYESSPASPSDKTWITDTSTFFISPGSDLIFFKGPFDLLMTFDPYGIKWDNCALHIQSEKKIEFPALSASN